MKKHTKVYLSFFGYDFYDFIPCEVCGQKVNDVHHIEARGMGGTSKEEDIYNLMGLCRTCHDLYGDKTKYKTFLKNIHAIRIDRHKNP